MKKILLLIGLSFGLLNASCSIESFKYSVKLTYKSHGQFQNEIIPLSNILKYSYNHKKLAIVLKNDYENRNSINCSKYSKDALEKFESNFNQYLKRDFHR